MSLVEVYSTVEPRFTDTRFIRTVVFVLTKSSYIFSYIIPLNTDTQIIRTLLPVLFSSILTGFDCAFSFKELAHFHAFSGVCGAKNSNHADKIPRDNIR